MEYHTERTCQHCISDNVTSSHRQRYTSTYKTPEGHTVQTPVETVQTLFPLLLETTPPEQLDIIVSHLTNSSKFWLPYPVPSVSADAPQACPHCVMAIKIVHDSLHRSLMQTSRWI